MSNSLIDREITQGVIPIGTPKAYKYDAALVEAAKASVQQGMNQLHTDGNSIISQANTILAAIRNQGGYPLKAATASAMTDTTKIYVYTGSETGYTFGDWYYHNGTAWTDGGVYNAIAFNTDPTLTISGAAADAKVTGGIRKSLADSSVVGNSFSVLAGTNHSSTLDQVYVNIKAGDAFAVWAGTTPTKNAAIFVYYADGTSEQVGATEGTGGYTYAGGKIRFITANKQIESIGLYVGNPSSDTVCKYIVLSDAMLPTIYNDALNSNKDLYVYFSSGAVPTFTSTSSDGTNVASVSVTFPNYSMRIYSGNNNVAIATNITAYQGVTFTVTTLEKLVYDFSDQTVKVLPNTFTEGGPYLLLLEVGGAVNGALASYYFASNSIRGDNQGKLQIYSPGNVYIEQDTTNLKVYIKTNAMYVRPFPSISHTWSQFLTEIGETGVTSPKGETNCLCLNGGKDLVFNIASKTFKIVARDSLSVEDIVVIAQVSGILYYIIPTLLNAGMNREYFDKKVSPQYMEFYYNQKKYWLNVNYKADFKCLFFSDIHGGERNMNRIVEFANMAHSDLDCIINGGDTVLSTLESGLDWYNTAVGNYSVDVLVCAGNHDEWTGSVGTAAAKTATYNALFAPMVSNVDGIVQPTDAATNGDMYYYKDFNSKIRVIVIDAMDGGTINHYDSAQATWFAHVLEDARTNNLAVLCVNHAPYGKNDVGLVRDSKLCWNSWKPYSAMDGHKIAEGALTAVDTFITNGGVFIAWITGHTHMDNVLTNTRYPGQFMFSTATAFQGAAVDGERPSFDTGKGVLYDCFNFMGVDTTNHFLKWWRIGYGVDVGMKKRSVFCYDYANRTIVTDR